MNILLIIALALIWGLLGVIGIGFYIGAYKQASYNYFDPFVKSRLKAIMAIVISGPCFLFAVLTVSGWKHWSLKPHTREERYAIFVNEYGSDFKSFEDFDKIRS